MRVDMAGAGFSRSDWSTVVDVKTDGANALVLDGIPSSARVLVDGIVRTLAGRAGTATVVVPAGTHQIRLARSGRVGDNAVVDRGHVGSIPTTGGDIALPVLAVVMLGLGASLVRTTRRRRT